METKVGFRDRRGMHLADDVVDYFLGQHRYRRYKVTSDAASLTTYPPTLQPLCFKGSKSACLFKAIKSPRLTISYQFRQLGNQVRCRTRFYLHRQIRKPSSQVLWQAHAGLNNYRNARSEEGFGHK